MIHQAKELRLFRHKNYDSTGVGVTTLRTKNYNNGQKNYDSTSVECFITLIPGVMLRMLSEAEIFVTDRETMFLCPVHIHKGGYKG